MDVMEKCNGYYQLEAFLIIGKEFKVFEIKCTSKMV